MNRRLYPCVVLLVITVCSSSGIKNDPADRFPSIRFSDSIKINYKDIYTLIEDSIIGGKSDYRLSIYDYLSNTKNHLLYFTERDTSITVGGFTREFYDSVNDFLYDTIVLNSEFLRRGCREYIIQVIVHESLHAFINWSRYSFHEQKNNVNDSFLQTHFSQNWEWIAKYPNDLTEVRQHSLMAKNYLYTIRKCIYEYTNPDLDISVQDMIARSLAWGGLEGTPEWKNRVDTCLSRFMDAAAIKFNAPPGGQFIKFPPCLKARERNRLLKQVRGAFQKTSSATYKGVSL